MFASIGQFTFKTLVSLSLATAMLSLTGCADVVTFANKSHEEGMRLYHEKMYGDAAGAFRNAIRQDPRHYEAHFYLGVCYDELKQHQQAFQEYRTTVDVMRNTQAGKYEDEFRYMVFDTYASAIARYDENDLELARVAAAAKTSQRADDWFLLAKTYRLKGDADSAMDAYRRASKWDTQNFDIRKEFGLYLLDPLNQPKEAEYYLRQAYRLEPNDEAVNAALDRLGVVPPPAYKARDITPSARPAPRIAPPRPSLPGKATVQTPVD